MTTIPLGVGRMHEIARVDLPDAGAPVHRRGDRGVAELRARGVDLRLILRDLRLELRDRGLLRVGLLRGRVGGRRELL